MDYDAALRLYERTFRSHMDAILLLSLLLVLIEPEGGVIVHTRDALKQRHHPIGKAAPQQDRVGEVDRSSGCRCHSQGTSASCSGGRCS